MVVARVVSRSREATRLASRALALNLANRFVADIGAEQQWSAVVWSDGSEQTSDGGTEQYTVVELRRQSDNTFGYATLTGTAPGDEAQTEFVEQMHDVILELSRGAALPDCPGHPHPQSPQVRDGILTWHCPIALRGYV